MRKSHGATTTWPSTGREQTRRADRPSRFIESERPPMTSKRTAIVLGGSGSVGAALLRELFRDGEFDAVVTLARRSLPEAVAMARAADRTLVEKLVPDMKPGPLAAATLEAVTELDG